MAKYAYAYFAVFNSKKNNDDLHYPNKYVGLFVKYNYFTKVLHIY